MIITFARNGQEIGQYHEDEVPALVASGEILPSDDYWHEGLSEWRKVGERWPLAEAPRRLFALLQAKRFLVLGRRSRAFCLAWKRYPAS